MTAEGILIWLLVGAIAGWLAGIIVKGYGFGLLGNIAVGVVGAMIGGWLFGSFGVVNSMGLLGVILGATAGAVLLLLALRIIRQA